MKIYFNAGSVILMLLMVFLVVADDAEASWGASRFIESKGGEEVRGQAPSNQSMADLIRNLRGQSSMGSQTPTQTPEEQAPSQRPQQPSQPEYGARGEVGQVLEMLNNERQKRGLSPLTLDQSLTNFAQERSNYISQDPFARMNHRGMAAGGENLSYTGSITRAHSLLMASPEHRRNLLGSGWSRVGIGVSYCSRGYVVVVQSFQ